MKAKIDRLGMNGEGIFNILDGADKGKVAFVDFALPGEDIECDIIKNNSKYCKCRLISVDNKCVDRVEPKCKYFYACGGCDLLHMSDDLQMSLKKKKILDAISKIDNNINDIKIVGENNLHYRNKMVFPFDYRNDRIILGMFEKNSHNVVSIDKCLLASNNINKLFQLSKEYFFKESRKFIELKNSLRLKYLVVREVNNSYLVSIVVNKKFDFADYYQVLENNFKDVGLSIVIGENDQEILSGKYCHLYGKKTIDINEFGIDYNIDIMSFMQVNNDIKKELYQTVLDNVNADDVVIDAYSGAGLMSGIVAKKCKQVVGIEINKFAHNLSKELAQSNNLVNLINICGNVDFLLERCCKKHNPNTIILDPARSGCGKEVVKFLSGNNKYLPETIIYVSCNLATLKRDLMGIKNNYSIKSVCGFNMFPQTKHIETLVCLQRREKN